MSNFATGFLQSLGDAAHQRAARQHQLDMEEKQKEAQFHWGALDAAIKRGGYTDGQGTFHQYSPDDYNNMVQTTIGNISKGQGTGKAVKEIYQKAQGMIGAVSQHPDFWGGAGAPPAGTPGLQPPDANSAASGPAPVPSTPGSAPVTADTSQAPAGTSVSALTIPPPPGASASAYSPDASSDASSLPAPVAVASHPDSSIVGSAPTPDAAPMSGVSAPPDGGAVTSVDTPTPDASAAAAGPSAPAGAPNPGKVIQGLVPPGAGPAQIAPIASPPATSSAPGYTPNQMLHAFESPEQSALRQANLAGIGNQRAFELQQQQLQQKIAAYEKNVGRKANSTEVALMSGIKLPAGMLVPHYNSKVVMADNVPTNGIMVDGSSPSEHKGQILQQIGQGPDMTPIYNVTDMAPKYEKIGNLYYAFNPITHENLGPVSDIPVNAGTSTSRIAPISTVGPDGKVQQYAGSTSTAPNTIRPKNTASPVSNATAASGLGIPNPPSAAGGGSVSTPKQLGKHAAAVGNATQPAASTVKGAGASSGAARTLGEGEIPVGQWAQQQKRNTSINNAGGALKIFSQPNEGYSNLDIFKDPSAVSRIRDYLTMNNQSIEGDFNKAQESGISGTLEFMAGLPAAYNNAKNEQVGKLYNSLTGPDKRFVADYYSLLGQWGGMRAATGASGSKYNFLNLSQEIPNPMSITDYPSAIRKIRDNISELNRTARPNTKADVYSESDILPPSTKPKALQPPSGKSTPASSAGKGVVSLSQALTLPENKGKTSDQVSKHITSLGYTVGP